VDREDPNIISLGLTALTNQWRPLKRKDDDAAANQTNLKAHEEDMDEVEEVVPTSSAPTKFTYTKSSSNTPARVESRSSFLVLPHADEIGR
jgi:hypothetical protein